MRTPGPIRTEHLFAPLHAQLIALLRSLSAEEWNAPTAAGAWTVKDVSAHLLDTAMRRLSLQRDGHVREGPFDPNATNAAWVAAMHTVSPRVLIELMERYGRENASYLAALDPFAAAKWGVSWAGEEESPVWFDVARELTERWHHQQQIRDALGRVPLHEPYLRFVMDTFVRALPFTYRDVQAPEGTSVVFNEWTLMRGDGWQLFEGRADNPTTVIEIPNERAWRVFTKQKIDPQARIAGDARYAEPVLRMVTVIG
ncbi:MAG TPA: maleylpyruvate isomerase family mycothiol-dependent enzyme [Thermoanaerobaculia bacterium]|nr:maleylpyruvate isomerase family mycothiol-dependent enzyme [Thermoanaerobaculia bacterium]